MREDERMREISLFSHASMCQCITEGKKKKQFIYPLSFILAVFFLSFFHNFSCKL